MFCNLTALSKVCEKANSVKTATVDAPTWIHKYIIGKNGSNIKKITQDFSKVSKDLICNRIVSYGYKILNLAINMEYIKKYIFSIILISCNYSIFDC